MQIITGKHRGRKLQTMEAKQLRPTMSRVREAMFNILCHGDLLAPNYLNGIDVLDIFCGTGSLGFEALSRGAESIMFIDKNREAINLARNNAKHLKEEDTCHFLCADATMLPPSRHQFHLVFLDAPYDQNLTIPCLRSLLKGNWLVPGALLCVEVEKKEDILLPEGYEQVDERSYSRTKLVFLRNQ